MDGKPQTLQSSSIIYKTLNPVWNQEFSFKNISIDDWLRIEVYDHDNVNLNYVPSFLAGKNLFSQFGSDDFLGVCVLPLSDVEEGGIRPYDLELQQTSTGFLKMDLTLTHAVRDLIEAPVLVKNALRVLRCCLCAGGHS